MENFYSVLADVHYRKLKNWARKCNRLNDKQVTDILHGKCIGIDVAKIAGLRPYLTTITIAATSFYNQHDGSHYIYHGRNSLFWIPFFSYYSNVMFALGFERYDLAATILMQGFDDCNEVIILSTSERDILRSCGILMKRSREETRINAIKVLTNNIIEKYGK